MAPILIPKVGLKEKYKADLADNPCPNCGYHRRRYLMSSNPDGPGIRGLLRGEGDPVTRAVAWAGVLLFAVLVAAALFAVAGIH